MHEANCKLMMISPDELVAELNALGVRLLTGGSTPRRTRTLPPADLLAALASNSEARLRLALIPLLLVRAEYYGPWANAIGSTLG